ncbi:MAG: LytR C-terminal domain-containing protein [Acidimicrobiia bacterium]|nr:LytR C-terminal domain-containing protein [Acidimicrobiia bacterium]
MPDPQHKGTRRAKPEAPPSLSARELNRAARLTQRRLARRKMLLATLGAIVILAATVAASWFWLREGPQEAIEVDLPPDQGASALVVIKDGSDLVGAWLVAAHPTHASRVVVFPPSTLAVVPGYGEQTLSDSLAFEDDGLLALTITNMLGVRIDAVISQEVSDLAAVLTEPIDVDLIDPLMVSEGDIERVAIAAGNQARDASQVITLLTEPGTGDESDLVLRQAKVVEGIMAAIAGSADLADRLSNNGPALSVAALLGAAVDEDLTVASLPVQRVDTLSAGAEQYAFNTAGLAEYVERAFPYLTIKPEPRVVVEILNGNGGVGVTAPIAERLVLAGYRVLKTDNASRDDYETTQIIAQGREHQQNALDARTLLGLGDVLLEVRQPSGVFDLVIIVGDDL